MRSIIKTGMFFLLLTLCYKQGTSQVLEGIEKSFGQYNDEVLQEKIYTHTDKGLYLTGEVLWFKIYNVDAGSNKPVSISKVAYAEVLDGANNPVLQAKIALSNGLGNGSFYLPVTLKNGNYKFRVYTNWMKNFSPDLYFEKTITIINPLADATAPAKPFKTPYDLQFFPEGGTLISGVANTLAFKATGTDGKSLDINGVVINQRNDTIVRFQSLKFGMGSFSFTPDASNTYKAVVRIGRDNALITDLPPIATNGFALHLINTNSRPELKISTRGQGNQPLYLFVHSGHKVVIAQRIVPDENGNATAFISKEKLGPGINHITLFNSTGQPVSERLYFNRPPLLALWATAQFQYKTRQPVAVNISANDNSGKPQVANLSVAVYRLDSLNNADDKDIASYLWLEAELKGNIESPGYYFNAVTAETDKALDNLLLTQGWSRFKWNDVLSALSKHQVTFLPEYNGHLITGQLTGLMGKPAPGIIAYLGVIGKRVQLYGANADSTGRLLFNTKDMYGPGEIVVQTNTEQDSVFHINISTPFSEQYSSKALPALQLNSQLQKPLEKNSIAMQVQNIYSYDKLRQYYNPPVDSSAFYGNLYKPYMLDDFTRFITMEEVLREYVAEVNIVRQQKRFHIKVIGYNGFLREGDPLVLLDGIPIFNIDKVFTIDPLKVKRLEMINRVYYWGPIFASGILSYTTYKGDMGGFEIDPRAVVLDYEGMQLQREFYSPVYETESQQHSRLPDFRNVLYWSPNVNTDTSGKAKVSFYTSDKAGKYMMVLQGITADGQAGSHYLKFDVTN